MSAYCLLLRQDLTRPQVPAVWPEGVSVTSYREALAAEVHALLVLGYADGGGTAPDFDTWRTLFTGDAEYHPQLCFIARDQHGIVAVAQCWTSAFIKDLVVHPRARRQGLAQALLLHVFETYRQRREAWVDLKVLEDNQPARRLYEGLGMQRIQRVAL